MRKRNLFVCLSLSLFLLAGCSGPSEGGDRERLFNDDWKFLRDSVTGAEAVDYDDTNWATVDLPHDFAILPLSGEDSEDKIGPFSKESPGMNFTGHVMDGTGWYRKAFKVEAKDADKCFTLVFDGAFMETDVWVNGKYMGENKHGYTGFAFDITDALRPVGEENVVAVKVANIGSSSRWYSGEGLYRDVHLMVTDPLHVDLWGAYITTPVVSKEAATVDVEVSLSNAYTEVVSAEVSINILNAMGQAVTSTTDKVELTAGSSSLLRKRLEVDNPALWSMDHPNLYKAEIAVKKDGKTVDTYIQPFGIRTLEFSAEKGFLLNGEPVLLKGGCLHHDNGFLGSAAFKRAEYRKVELMKRNGYNAIRSSHNPPSTHLLNACDEMGVLVIDEFVDVWTVHKVPQDYATFFTEYWENDLTNMMLRDRNHPSIIMWSIGNEIFKFNVEEGVRMGEALRDKVKEFDTTRPVTEAVPNFMLVGGWPGSRYAFDVVDVCGYNYMQRMYVPDHEQYPDRIMFGSETYPGETYENWYAAEHYPYVLGDFVWTAMDYIGEVLVGSSEYVKEIPYRDYDAWADITKLNMAAVAQLSSSYVTSKWPNFIAWCGDLNIIGEKKPQSYYKDVVWDNTVIEMNVHEPIPEGMVEDISRWGWPREYPSWDWEGNEGKPLQVRVFTKAPQVRLELNGETIGEKALTEADKYIATFHVPYQAGTLTAIALNDGQEIGRKELSTTGKATALKLTVDRSVIQADRNDLAYIRIDAVDGQGRTVQTADMTVDVTVDGDGELVATGNANPADMKSVNRQQVRLYRGQAQAIVRPFAKAGDIRMEVRADGLPTEELNIKVK